MATLVELKARAKKMGYKGYSKMKKGELEKLLTTPPPKPPRTKPVSQRVPIKQVIPKTELLDSFNFKPTIGLRGSDEGLSVGIGRYITTFMSEPSNKEKYMEKYKKLKIKEGEPFRPLNLPKITIKNKVRGKNLDFKISAKYDINPHHNKVNVQFDLPKKIDGLEEAVRMFNKDPYSGFDDTTRKVLRLTFPSINNPKLKKFGTGLTLEVDKEIVEKYKNTDSLNIYK
jgi:hypothetical protein